MEATPARRGTRPMNINAAVDCGRRQNCFQIPGEFSSSGPAAASTDKHFNVAGSVISRSGERPAGGFRPGVPVMSHFIAQLSRFRSAVLHGRNDPNRNHAPVVILRAEIVTHDSTAFRSSRQLTPCVVELTVYVRKSSIIRVIRDSNLYGIFIVVEHFVTEFHNLDPQATAREGLCRGVIAVPSRHTVQITTYIHTYIHKIIKMMTNRITTSQVSIYRWTVLDGKANITNDWMIYNNCTVRNPIDLLHGS